MADTKVLLVVDDSQTIRRAVEMVFSATEYAVVAVSSAAEALVRAPTIAADLALVDADMPGVSGYELAKRLKDDPKTAELPVLLMVADQSFDRAKVDEADIDGHVTKPFRSRDLLDIVKMLTGGMVTAEGPRSFEERLELFRLEETARGRKNSIIEERPVSKVGAAPPRAASKVPRPDEGLELDFQFAGAAPKTPGPAAPAPAPAAATGRKPPPSAPPVVSEAPKAPPPPPPDPSADLPAPPTPAVSAPAISAPVVSAPIAAPAPEASAAEAAFMSNEAASPAPVPELAPEKPRWRAFAAVALIAVIVGALFMLSR
jgi:CheY-like chemotaxis protein